MAQENLMSLDTETDLELGRTQTAGIDGSMLSFPSPPLSDDFLSDVSPIGLRQLLAKIPDSDSYQVALVSSAERVGAGQNASRPAVAAQVLFLPLTWKDLSVLMPTGKSHRESLPGANEVRFGEVHVDFYRMQVTRRGTGVVLTAQEFKVLKFMVLNPNRAISRDELLNEAWGYDNYPCTRTVDSHIWRLRGKLELDPSSPSHFRTISRVGYMFVPNPPCPG